jgi:hypothetical protein
MSSVRELGQSPLAAALLIAVSATSMGAADLTGYRNFKFGSSIAVVAREGGMEVTQARVVPSQPGFIHELEWRPGNLRPPVNKDAVRHILFTFFDGELFRIVADYDRHETEGMTVDDFIEAISTSYGTAVRPPPAAKPTEGSYSGPEEVVAQWQDPLHRYELIRSAYGPTFRLVGTLKGLEAPARAALAEGARVHEQQAPQREAARLAKDEAAASSRLEKARQTNKPTFRP